MLLLSAVLDPVGDSPRPPVPAPPPDAPETAPDEPPGRFYALEAWLKALLQDLERIDRSSHTP
jgi:hypothetical protein